MCSIRIRNARDPDDPFSGYSKGCDWGGIQRCMYDWRDEDCFLGDEPCRQSAAMWAWDTSAGHQGLRFGNYRALYPNEFVGCLDVEDAINRGVL